MAETAASLSARVTPSSGLSAFPRQSRHAAFVRVTHWLTTAAFFALLLTGAEIVVSHPRFYWGETGNVNTQPLFSLHIPSSRPTVPTGYGFVLPDQNGWSRYLHFEAAWLLVITGFVYVTFALAGKHFARNVLPEVSDLGPKNLAAYLREHSLFGKSSAADASSYNVLQRLAYSLVIFVLCPLVIWTGLDMSPTFAGAVPWAVMLMGGRQSARTIHFFVSGLLVVFLLVHVFMVAISGFRARMAAMITGGILQQKEQR
jgi:thiosulfate reductase cytochrome b subunit